MFDVIFKLFSSISSQAILSKHDKKVFNIEIVLHIDV